ncbi:MAG TPA: HAD family hydrolase [Candidatus Dormibacteraeota bacterium]|nr:HAD family hydrolase [Candidatus Dormibacteraeota bacterium]
MGRALEVALIDVGGTLWPNSWPFRQTDATGRMQRLARALPDLDEATVSALGGDLIAYSRAGDETPGISTADFIAVSGPAETLITNCLTRHRLPSDPETVRRIRRAMALPVHDRMKPLPGAADLLVTIHELGMRNVITSNTYWRDSESYWEDFRLLGLAEHIDNIVTSNDAGHLKPHPAIFETAMRWAGVAPVQCVVIGNSEANDVEPALKLGMASILVYPDDPKPASSRATRTAADLWACALALRDMLG